jgi:alpha-D-xyloside xylohydrolase
MPKAFDAIKKLVQLETRPDGIRLDLETVRGRKARLRVQSLGAGIWRLTFLPPGAKEPAPTPFLISPARHRPNVRVRKTSRGIRLEGAPAEILEIVREPWAFRFIDRRGRTILSDASGDVDGIGRPFVLPLGFAASRLGPLAAASFRLAPDERLFGLGEKFTRADKVHQKIIGWTVDALGSTTERSHKNIPFLLSSNGYGLFVNSAGRLTWELATESSRSYTLKLEDSALDIFLVFAPDPASILLRYTKLTGRAPVPPKWSFGLWFSSGGTYRTQAQIERLVAEIGRHRFPAGVVHVDPWWMRGRRYCDFEWDRKAFPDPEGLIRKVRAAGLKLCLWEHPYVSVESELFVEGRRRGYFAKRPGGGVYVIDYGLSLAPKPDGVIRRAGPGSSWNAKVAIVDFTNPEATAWWKDLHRPLFRMGVDVFKTDFGKDIPRDAVFADGSTGATTHNLYPLLYNRAVFEVTAEEKGRGLVWSRSGTAGSQRYPVCWSGDPAADWDSLAATIRGGLSAAISGIPFWSHDIGGYRGSPNRELYIRWAQFGLLSSHSRMHGDSPREPWRFGDRAERIVRKFARLRYRLFPYLYSLAHEAHRTGLPVIRPLGLVFPNDPGAWDKDLEFMLGPWLLVAPIYEGNGERWVYLPTARAGKGAKAAGDDWIDFWTGERFAGGQNIRVRARLDRLPFFVRAGAIIPTMRPALRIPEGPIDALILEIYAAGSSSYRIYEDAGATDVSCQSGGGILVRWQSRFPRRMILRFNGIPGAKGKAAEIAFAASSRGSFRLPLEGPIS